MYNWWCVIDERAIGERFRLLSEQGVLDERGRRLWAAAEARSAGRGGIAAVVRATGISESMVTRGLADLDSGEVLEAGRVRRAGAGQVAILEREPGLWEALEGLVDPVTRGDLMSPLRWTSKSAAKLAAALREKGHDVVDRTVLRLLKSNGYSLQANKKTREGASHPDRDAQFEHISRTVADTIAAGEPVISVDIEPRGQGSARPAAGLRPCNHGRERPPSGQLRRGYPDRGFPVGRTRPVDDFGVEIRSIGPHDAVAGFVDRDATEQLDVAQRLKHGS
jgi:hypothetical protein